MNAPNSATATIYRTTSIVGMYLDIDPDLLTAQLMEWTKGMKIPMTLVAEQMYQMVCHENKLLPWFYPIKVNGQDQLPDRNRIIKLFRGDRIKVGNLPTVSIQEDGPYQIDAATGKVSLYTS